MADLKHTFSTALDYLRSLAGNRFFWIGLAGLVGFLLVLYVAVNYYVMPAYTRHGDSIAVPAVINEPFDQAENELQKYSLDVEKVEQRYNSAFPRGVVIDQNPSPNAAVKPGRHIYLTVNSGEVRKVRVPSLDGLSLREAVNRLKALGLEVRETRPDSIPAPNPNTVTRQEPIAGDSLAEGSRVALWYSTGLGQEYVTIPDVTGMTVKDAETTLLEARLRSIVVGGDEGEDVSEEEVQRQSREPGTRVPAGFEVRLYLSEEAPLPPEE